MKVLELFSGTESFSNTAKKRGHDTFTIDNDPQFKSDLTIDIMKVTPELILEKFGRPDIIWASPPCQKFSVMTIYRNWKKLEDGTYLPTNDKVLESIEWVKKTLDLIDKLKPKFFFIENPRAMLRKQDFMPNDKRKTVTYCKYGLMFQKATDIWNNCDTWVPKLTCSNGDPCHVRAPRGSKTGIQGAFKQFPNRNGQNPLHPGDVASHDKFYSPKVERGRIPEELCEEIIKAVEDSLSHNSGKEVSK